MGELSYFPNGNDDSEFGSFRFSRTDGTVNQGVPSAKVGANQFWPKFKSKIPHWLVFGFAGDYREPMFGVAS